MPKSLLTKTQINDLIRSGRAHECFTHSIVGTFDISLMIKVAPFLYSPFTSDLNSDLITKIKKTRDWEQNRVDSLTEDEIQVPTLWILDESDNTHILADGTHRLIALFERFNKTKFRGYMATLSTAIRPSSSVLLNASHDWGRMEVRGNKLYDRATGKEIE